MELSLVVDLKRVVLLFFNIQATSKWFFSGFKGISF